MARVALAEVLRCNPECFGSEYVRTKIAPDGAKFNDLETGIPLMVVEKSVDFESKIPSSAVLEEGYRTITVLFVANTFKDTEEQIELIFSPILIKALQKHAPNDVYRLQANISIPSSQFDIRAHFGGKNMPEYPVTYKIYMKDKASITALQKAQKAFMGELSEQVDASNTIIAFGKEGLILDVRNGAKVSH